MSAENASAFTDLPLWIQAALTIGAGIATAVGGVVFGKRGHRAVREHEDIADELLESSPIRKFLESVETVTANQKLQTEALRTIAVAVTAIAKILEDEFDEQRIDREIARRLGEQRKP